MTHAAPLALGWFSLCLRAQRYPQTVAWYEALGFEAVDGNPEHGYVVLANGPTVITLMSFLQANLLCFRGADVEALAGELAGRGLSVYHQAGTDPSDPAAAKRPGHRAYDPSAWPAEFHTDADGELLATAGAGDLLLDDPDGHALYFDSVPVERARYAAGERYNSPGHTGELAPGQPELGRFVVQLRVADLAVSQAFYARLGLTVTKTIPELGYVELGNDLAIPFTVGLNAKTAPCDVLYFECPDLGVVAARVAAAADDVGLGFEMVPAEHPDGATMASLRDPEGNLVFFRQAP